MTKNPPKIALPITADELENAADLLAGYVAELRTIAKFARSQPGRFLALYGHPTFMQGIGKVQAFCASSQKAIYIAKTGSPLEPGQVKDRSTALNDPKKMALIQSEINDAQALAKKLIKEQKKVN
jgi:hypothetical protein